MRTLDPGPSLAPLFQFLRAQPADAPALTELALAAKRHWRYPEEWMSIWTPVLTITPDFIQLHEVYSAQVGGEMAGFYALVPAEQAMLLEHLWVRPALIGRRIGRALFLHACERSRQLRFPRLQITADPNAQGFYERMGARQVGEERTAILGQPRALPVLELEL
jgi:GNAT superfamily N-acetyltransferase